MNRAGAIGLFGGTFDPVHYGHLRAALEARDKLGLDSINLVPAGTPPHRDPPVAEGRHRLEMLRLALDGSPRFRVDDREIRRGGPSYMVDTLAGLRDECGDAPLILLIGQDAANNLDTWHQWRRLFELAHLAVMRRPDAATRYRGELGEMMQERLVEKPAGLMGTAAGRVVQLEITQLEISATAIRQSFSSGTSPRFLLPDSVISYIRRHQLY